MGLGAFAGEDSLDNPFPQAAQHRGRRFGFQYHRALLILAGIDVGTGFEQRQQLAFFLWDAEANPAGAVLVDGDLRFDGPQLEKLVAGLAGGLRSMGVKRGDVVTWQMPNWWEALVLYRACWRCGAAASSMEVFRSII